MHTTFVSQPWQDGSNLDDYLDHVAADATSAVYDLTLVTAWAKRSGLSRIEPHLAAIRSGGGSVEMVIGISEGGATRQGLELALAVADKVHVFHDPAGRTFHPKVYLARSAGADAHLLVGSHNLTAGGLYFNYESGLMVTLSSSNAEDLIVLNQVETWIARLTADADCCRQLTPDLLESLLNNPSYRIGDEDKTRKPAVPGDESPGDTDSVTSDGAVEVGVTVFTPSASPKKGSRYSGAGKGSVPATTKAEKLPKIPGPFVPEPRSGPPVARWSKLLKGSDAQQPPTAGTSPTGNLRLSASGHDIDITTYFRDEFFAGLPWQADPEKTDVTFTEADFDVVVSGQSLGVMRFRVDYNESRIAHQNNVPTVLKWGPMNAILRANDHVGDWVLLEKFADGYRLEITATDPATK